MMARVKKSDEIIWVIWNPEDDMFHERCFYPSPRKFTKDELDFEWNDEPRFDKETEEGRHVIDSMFQ